MGEQFTDKEILSYYRGEETKHYGFNLLVRKYQEKLYWHIRRMVISHDDADDIMQNMFLKVWKNLDNFREDSQLYTWLYRIATNETLTFLKKKKMRYFLPLIDVEQQLENSLEDNVYFSGNEIQKKLQKAILQLPEKQRLVFNMKYYDDMKYEEIAKIVNTSVGALKASYHHAVKKIEEFIKSD